MRLSAVDRRALELGLTAGLPLADARARVQDLCAVDANPYDDQDWLERLCDGARRYTPLAALDAPHGLVLDITGCAHLFGGEAGLAADVEVRLQRAGMAVRHAFAATPEAAHALARYQTAPAADEGGAVRRLPVAALRLDLNSEIALRRAGLNSIGDVANQSAAAIAARFGSDAVDMLHRLLGLAARPLDPRRALPAVMVERRFAEPVARTEHSLGVLAELVQEAADRLAERGQGGRRFHALFFRTDGAAFPLRVETGLPTRDVDAVMRLMRERIDSLSDPIDPGFGFDMVRLSVPRAELLAPDQLDLGDGGAAAARARQADLSGLVDTLSTRAGRRRVQRLEPVDTHIPEQAQLALPAVEAKTPLPWPDAPSGEPQLRPLHLFDPPQPIDVMAQAPDGPPSRFRWRRRQHDVRLFEGPERIAPEWWLAADGTIDGETGLLPHTRDYYRVEDMRGRRFWLYRDGQQEGATPHPAWYVHGLFA